jgi:hypothetical protein
VRGAAGAEVIDGSAGVLAHQGGWDEMLFVLVPISLFAGLLALANKRAMRDQAEREGLDAGDPAAPGEAEPSGDAGDPE